MLYPAELKTLVENDIYVIIRIIFCQDFFKENLLNLLEQVVGIEPTFPAWKAGVLPIYDTRILVQMKGVEPPRRKALDPKSSASANSATSAFGGSPGNRTRDTMIKSHVLYRLS